MRQSCNGHCGITLSAVLHIAGQHHRAAGDVGDYVTVAGKNLMAVKGLPDEPVDFGWIHVEANLDLVLDVAYTGQAAHGHFRGRALPAVLDQAGQRQVAVL